MSSRMSYSRGVQAYRKPLKRKRRSPLWYVFFAVILFAIGAYIFVLVSPVQDKKANTDIPPGVPITTDKIVLNDGRFVRGRIISPVKKINFRDAKIEGVRKIFPLISATTYKERLSFFFLKDNSIMTLHLDNFNSVRVFRYAYSDIQTHEQAHFVKQESYRHDMDFSELLNKAEMHMRKNSLRLTHTDEECFINTRIDKKLRAGVQARKSLSLLQYMMGWPENQALYNRVRACYVEGMIEVPGKTIPFTTNDIVMMTYHGGVAPIKYLENKIYAIVSNYDGSQTRLISFSQTRPHAEIPSEAYMFNGSNWIARGNFDGREDGKTKRYRAVSDDGKTEIVFIPHTHIPLPSGLIFPKTKHLEYHGITRLRITDEVGEQRYEGLGVRIRARSLW